MARGRKVVLGAGVVVLAVASPLAYTLASAGVGDVVSASIIAATAAAALAVPLWPGHADGLDPAGGAVATDTGGVRAVGGGDANTGVRRRRGVGGAARARRTGNAVAQGPGSRANSGVEEAD